MYRLDGFTFQWDRSKWQVRRDEVLHPAGQPPTNHKELFS